MNKGEKISFDMEQMIKKDHESMLSELKEIAHNIEIDKRKEFETQLLQLAREITDDQKRSAIYEVLVSLQTIWNQYQPEKGLQEKFRAAFEAGSYKEAEEIYKRLSRQGLDYIGTFQTGEGRLIPLSMENTDMLLHYNRNELTFYNLRFEPLVKIPKITMPVFLEIIDVYVPSACQAMEGMEADNKDDSNRKVWMLFENHEGKKGVVSIDKESIHSKETIYHCLEHQAIYLDEKLNDVHSLFCFQNHLLLVSKKWIYYYKENGEWEEWYNTNNEITSVEPARQGFWVGHDNGDVFMLKNLQYVGVREVFKGSSEAIRNIRETGKFVLISSKNCLRIADYSANPVSEPIATQCAIMQTTILNDEYILLLLANGMLMTRELIQKNICWEINLGDIYDTLFTLKDYVYCVKRNGKIMRFEIPPFQTMAKELESKNIYVEKKSCEVDPNAPVRYIPDFIGRKEILNKIKQKYNAHFLFYGEPRVGKTSLLNVLRDALFETARCCVVDMVQLLKETNSCETFERKFMEKCLEQHFMKPSDLQKKAGYHFQVLLSMIEKIKGKRNFCVFGMDNFFIPEHFDKKNEQAFIEFLRSMFLRDDVRLIITCSNRGKDNVERYIERLNISSQRKFFSRKIPLFSEGEVKNALRKNISLQQSVVEDIYKYTGTFPHLSHLYDRWKSGHLSIEEQSKVIAKTFSDKIFEYFRDLSMDAGLLIATCLHESLVSEQISYTRFYEKFPFLRNSLPKDQLDTAIEEIAGYGSGLSAHKVAEGFKISLSDNARLFREAAKHIAWIKNFKTLYDFTSLPNQKRAHQVARMFTKITQSALDSREELEQKTARHRDKFFVSKFTDQGLQALKMPLSTFVVFPLTPWRKELHIEAFQDLNIEFQEFNRKAGEGKIFYILLFELHGIPKETIKKDLEGLERIPIIDALMMKNIILADSPQDKATGYIFIQLSIRERSPYTTAGAVPDNLFFGRQMEIALIRGLPENIGIFGTRTIGKTSLLRRIHKYFQSQMRWKVYDMDCSRIESEVSLLKNLAEKMEVPFAQISDMGKFRRYLTREAENGGHRYLFLLDEVDRLVQYDIQHDEKIFNTFNRLYNETMKNNETAARFILSGFQQMFEQMKNPLSRLYNFMVFLPLQALDPEGAMSLVTRPIENIRVRWNNTEDAKYLVDSCSRHPRLLQQACHALLTNLDSKEENPDIIERSDVEKALNSQEFREICMRLYHDQPEEKNNDHTGNEAGKVEKKNWLFTRMHKKDTNIADNENTVISNKKKGFLSDLHRITILAAIRLLFEEDKEIFSITEIQNELKSYEIDITPNIMRNVLDQLCLSGNFRLRDESTIIAKEGKKIQKKAEQIEINNLDLSVDHPDIYVGSDATIPRFTYEFVVKIFPKLLVAHFGGIKQCEEERKKLIEKADWQEWLRRY